MNCLKEDKLARRAVFSEQYAFSILHFAEFAGIIRDRLWKFSR
jgi:hypothetical protein